MSTFTIDSTFSPNDNPFDRQERIEWWDTNKIESAKIMVVGAGAIGNETLKNLALLGVKNIFIVDMDSISITNLSRSVLFRKSDLNKKKAEVAAERTKELALANDIHINWFDGDIVWELGTGLYRYMTLILGCLDNIEARIEVNRQCWLANRPWIDSGINQLGLHVSVFSPPDLPCYQCSVSKKQQISTRQRYSCDDFKRKMLQEDKVPTVQVTSSLASAIQTQEAMKLICGQSVGIGKMISYQGIINDFDIHQIPTNHNCSAHVTYKEIISLPIESGITLEEFLKIVTKPEFSGKKAILDFSAFRSFILSATCRICGDDIQFYQPSFKIYDTDLICNKCKLSGKDIGTENLESTISRRKEVSSFGLDFSETKLLKMTLRELGVPYWPILAVKSITNEYKFYELTGDKKLLIP